MLTSLLVANRGEIACRIIRTARRLGIRTVAVYSDADTGALHVRQADERVHIGASPARESYLVGERIIAAALATGAEAIHPGYGFLSENADFAQSVIDAGLIWVGPKPASIRAMGLKDAAKTLMIAAGVPTTPGYLGEDQSPDRLHAEADAIGYPVLIKAVAGGGGKGMRRVDDTADFADALGSCRREAASSFGDDRVLLERYILSPRHIEVQVFGDSHGEVVHLFERDCSLQRRHQKVVEEAPAPGMDEATRQAICAAAVRAARAVDYEGAGTIEFIADASEGLRADRIWFMEMNTRLQVEHPVTEEITGVDLVEWQLRVASGETLPKRQNELTINGWAMEVRLYAEDPANGFLPSVGRLEHLVLPRSPEILNRVETGVEEGDEISPFYDPMIAKLITHSSSRRETIRNLRKVLLGTELWPVRSNAGFLFKALAHPAFAAGEVTTAFLTQHEDVLLDDAPVRVRLREQAALELVADSLVETTSFGTVGEQLAKEGVWTSLAGFRANGPPSSKVWLGLGDEPISAVELASDWRESNVWGEQLTAGLVVFDQGEAQFVRTRSDPSAAGTAVDGAVLSPMPGRVIAVQVTAGASVTKGQRLVTLEAMKMEHSLVAPFDGTVAELNTAAGSQVSEGAMLVRIDKI